MTDDVLLTPVVMLAKREREKKLVFYLEFPSPKRAVPAIRQSAGKDLLFDLEEVSSGAERVVVGDFDRGLASVGVLRVVREGDVAEVEDRCNEAHDGALLVVRDAENSHSVRDDLPALSVVHAVHV